MATDNRPVDRPVDRPVVRPVVVGVDASPSSAAALQYAAQEARRLGAPLKIVHVVPDETVLVPWWPMAVEMPGDMGARIVRDAAEEVGRAAPDVEVVGCVHHGGRAPELVRSAEHAIELVVGRDDRPLLQRLVRGDTATGVAAHADLPVVEVPPECVPGRPVHGVVLVGLRWPDRADTVLADAFAHAAAVGARLVVLHAWRFPSGYADIIETRVGVDEWRTRTTDQVQAVVEPWLREHPAVQVEVRAVHDDAGAALVEASRGADLVVVGRRRHGVPAALHLGGTARAVLRAASCPVRVVTAGDAG